jgi:biopolymer transport protein TolR
MGAQLNSGGGGYSSEINITPLVDVVLVLLIIFMVIVPVMMRGYDVSIPGEARVAPAAEERAEQIVLHIDDVGCSIVEPPDRPGLPAGCVVRINDTPVSIESLADEVATVYAQREGDDRVLFLAAQPALNYEYVMRILDTARSQVTDLKIGMLTVG